MIEKESNYVEAVGLILIGFAIYEMIFANPGPALIDRAIIISKEFDGPRFWAVLFEVCIITASLEFMQLAERGRLDPKFEGETSLRKIWNARYWNDSGSSRLNTIATTLWVIGLMFAWTAFGDRVAACLVIGFVLLIISIQRRGETSRNQKK